VSHAVDASGLNGGTARASCPQSHTRRLTFDKLDAGPFKRHAHRGKVFLVRHGAARLELLEAQWRCRKAEPQRYRLAIERVRHCRVMGMSRPWSLRL